MEPIKVISMASAVSVVLAMVVKVRMRVCGWLWQAHGQPCRGRLRLQPGGCGGGLLGQGIVADISGLAGGGGAHAAE